MKKLSIFLLMSLCITPSIHSMKQAIKNNKLKLFARNYCSESKDIKSLSGIEKWNGVVGFGVVGTLGLGLLGVTSTQFLKF